MWVRRCRESWGGGRNMLEKLDPLSWENWHQTKKNPITPCLGDEYYSRGRGPRERVSRRQGRMLRGVVAAGTWIQATETWPGWSRCSGLGIPLGAQHLLTLLLKAAGTQPREGVALPFPSPGDLPNPGVKPRSPALQANSLPSEPYSGSLLVIYFIYSSVCRSGLCTSIPISQFIPPLFPHWQPWVYFLHL